MRDRLKDFLLSAARNPDDRESKEKSANSQVEDAISALIGLGYKPQEASRYVHAVATEDMNSETIIREALKASVSK